MSETERPEERDEALLAELRAHFDRTDPRPEHVDLAAKAAFELRDLDAQIAELLRDSAVDDRHLAGVRGSATARLLTFAVGEERFVEVDVAFADGSLTLTGYLVPAAPGELTVEHGSGRATGAVDVQGRFSVARVSPGPVRLRFVVDGQAPIATQWITL